MSGDTTAHKDNVARVKDAIARYIVAVPASGSVNQMTVVATAPSGNGKPRATRAGTTRVIHRRTSSPWQAFIKQYVAKQRSAGSTVAFPQLVKDAAAEYKRGGLAVGGVKTRGFEGATPSGDTSGGADMQMGLIESMAIIPPTTDVPDSQIPATANTDTLDNIAAPTVEGTVAKQTNDTPAELDEPVGGVNVGKFVKGVAAAIRGTRDNYAPSSRKVLAGYGDIGFTEVQVCRKPLNDILQGVIRLAAAGKLSYDNLYHLSIRFKLHNGQWLRLDKRETAEATMGGAPDSATECRSVNIGAKSPRTVNGVIDATVAKVGKPRYFKYRATSWNCQRFVMDVIESAGFGIDADTRAFILQDMGDLFNPSVEAVANLSTDAKSRLSLILEGMGLAVGGAVSYGESDPYNQSSEYVISDGGDSIYLDAKTDRVRRAVARQYFTDNPYQTRGGCDCDSSDDDFGLLGGIRDAGLLRLRLSDKLGRFISEEEFADIIQDEEFGGLLVGGNFSDRVDTKLNMQYARAARANTWQNENDRITAILRRETRDRVKENAMKPREQLAYRRRQGHDLYNARRPQEYEPRGQVAGETFY